MAEALETAPPTIDVQDDIRRRSPAIFDKDAEPIRADGFEQEFGFPLKALGVEEWELDQFTLPSSMAHCHEARTRVDKLAEAAGMDQLARADIMLAVGEAVANAVEHGGANSSDCTFQVSCLAVSGRIWVSVRDSGPGFCPDELPSLEEAIMRERGRGVHCMNAVMDQVSFDFTSGTTVRMLKMG